MPIGILGGTFNPIHIGHLIIAEYVRQEYKLDRILFIPNGNPPHKSYKDIINARLRLLLIEQAIMDNCHFNSSDIELRYDKVNYTIDTLKTLKSQYSKEELFFIIGTDTLFELDSWKDFADVAKLTNFIVYQRASYKNNDVNNRIKELESKYGPKIFESKGPYVDISSTLIRNRLSMGLSIKYLVPESILGDVITIYGGKGNELRWNHKKHTWWT